MRKLNKWVRYLLYIVLAFGLLGLVLAAYLAIVAIERPPKPTDLSATKLERKQLDTNCYVIGNNWIRKSRSGLWEMYIEGDPFTRGVINGKLSKELVYEQEQAFSDQISQIVPSGFYRGFLKYLIAWFNRDLADNLTEEQKLEIYGVSLSASPKFDYIGSGYQRLMNYHAAHDIGHALQNLALVGCSSFATWNERSEDNQLIVGRNFDFYVGDRFAKDKIIEFCKPSTGYPFMMVTWGGMTGVLSGMNMEGISVTINAANSSVPKGSATPISLLSREILQYSKSIDDAIRIAKSRKTFVSESILVSSAHDNNVVIIEKTPDSMDVYTSKNELICTNHYQSNGLLHEAPNEEQMAGSASVYRHERMKELLAAISKNTPQRTAALLRDQLGLHNRFIGWGNEKAVNQLMAHHSIIFEPQRKMVWVSTNPWQLGAYMPYKLDGIFAMKGLQYNHELYDSANVIPADTFMNTQAYRDYVEFRKEKEQMRHGEQVDVQHFITLNPEYYHTYVVAGDYLFKKQLYAQAKTNYEIALTKEIATQKEAQYIRTQLGKCEEKLSDK